METLRPKNQKRKQKIIIENANLTKGEGEEKSDFESKLVH